MFVTPSIETTADGSQTLRHPLTGETYHSVNGAAAESEHVFICNGFEMCGLDHVRLLEAGFGSGLNALLTLRAAERLGRTVEYTAVELYPVSVDVVNEMELAADPIFVRLHEASWGVGRQIVPYFKLRKIEADLAVLEFDITFDLVYFDAFAPDCQPEMWNEEIFAKIFAALSPGGTLVTYCAKGDVKRALRSVGFEVARLQGAPGKRHMVRAMKRV